MSNIAILGPHSHIAKGILFNLTEHDNIHLFSTSFFNTKFKLHDYGEFNNFDYDIIINCVGVGTANKLNGNYTKYFTVLEEFDNLCLAYCKQNRNCLYISFSSGVVNRILDPNNITKKDFYAITRYYSEAKHRAYDLNIVDLRLYSYFSHFADFNDKYFITEVIKSALNKEPFITSKEDFYRDYLHHEDLVSAINLCSCVGVINDYFDIGSAKRVSKKEILDYFINQHSLIVEYKQDFNYDTATGLKLDYTADNSKAKKILGYEPKFDSLTCIIEESKYIMDNRRGL